MTSSLVGSEMCIRDSWTTLHCGKIHVALSLMSCRHGFKLPSIRALFGLTAVSYTHLTLPTICSV
eukprot:6788476-Prorocentrum_lima.AAC.1